MTTSFPDEVLEHVFSFLETNRDRNNASLVCKAWYEVERTSRRRVFIGNCYAASPQILIRRFPEIRSVEMKGKPHFADFNLVPEGWGGYLLPWVEAMVRAYPWLEELRLKRMVVTDETLDIIARFFKNFKVLVLRSCEGFSTQGLASIAAYCRNLSELDLRDNDIDDLSGNWLSHFPENCTSLVSLNISCLASEVSFTALERLAGRCTNLRSLHLNQAVPLDRLLFILERAPQLIELGTGTYSVDTRPEIQSKLTSAFLGCKNLKCLSGFWDVLPACLPAIYPVCCRITTLNLSFAAITSSDLVKLLNECPKLQKLWVLDFIEDCGLQALAGYCKDLQELRVFPSDPLGVEPNVTLTEKGLISVSQGCPKLNSILYFCRQMTNEALFTVANSCPNFIRFRLCIIEPHTPDYLTLQPLDDGFGAIVQHCKGLRRLSLSGLLTDRVFELIGTHAKRLEMLSVAFAGESDLGLHHVLSGCESLRKLEIRDSPFGLKAVLANAEKLETMRSLWMSSCSVNLGDCKLLSRKMPRLNVEIIDERDPPQPTRAETAEAEDDGPAEKLYIYRTVAGRRVDMPSFVYTMIEQEIGLS